MKNINMDHSGGWPGLAAAIIQQAAMDWIMAKLWLDRHRLAKWGTRKERWRWEDRNASLKEIESFFHSDYYDLICSIPGDTLIGWLQDLVDEELEKCARKSF